MASEPRLAADPGGTDPGSPKEEWQRQRAEEASPTGGTHRRPGALDTPRGRKAFVTTHWSMVARAGDAETPEGTAALEELCRLYWPPLYGFARRMGLTPHDAEDLTQGFFAHLLERGAIGRTDAARGRFRSFLLTSFRHFHAHERAHALSQKRGGGKGFVSLEALQEAESRFRNEPATYETPEKTYDREWAGRLLATARAAVEHEYGSLGKSALFDALRHVLWASRDEGGYAAAASRMGMSEGAVKMAALRLRRRLADELRAEVAKTVVTPEEIDDEVRHLLAAIAS